MEQVEMNEQEMQFLQLSKDLKPNGCGEDTENSAIRMFLKYSPDSLNRLFDLCVVKPCYVQVQMFIKYLLNLYFIFTLISRFKVESILTFFYSTQAVRIRVNRK